MFTQRFLLPTLILAYSLASLPCVAQDNATVSLQFLAFPQQLQPEPVELVVGQKETIEVQTPGNELSPTYKMPRLVGSIVVGETIENELGEDVFKVYGKANLIDAPKQIILLFRKGDQNSDGFAILPIDGDLSNFSGGSYLFINASKMRIAGKIGDQRFELSPGQRSLLQPESTHVGGGCQVTLAYHREDKWKVFKDTRWTTTKRYRSLIFFHQDPISNRLSVSPIIDMLPYVPPGTG